MRDLLFTYVFRPIARPITRLIINLAAVPAFRFCFQHVSALERLDNELEKDLAEWFRACLILFLITANMETALWHNLIPFRELLDKHEWLGLGLRLMLAIAVVQMMPDQEFFSLIHPGPRIPKRPPHQSRWSQLSKCWKPITLGLVAQHLSRSSPVFAILAVIFPGGIGWFCFAMAAFQYLIIGLVTSRDRAIDVLTIFDAEVAARRRELLRQSGVISEFARNETALKQEISNSQDDSACCE